MSTTEERGPGGCPVKHLDPATLQELVTPLTNHRIWDEIRNDEALFWSPAAQGFWVFTKNDLIRDALQRADLFSNSAVVPTDPDPLYRWIPEMLDPPEHTQWRQLLSPKFSPGAVAGMEDKVRQRCVEVIESFRERGECEFMREFAMRYPTSIFMELMGMPIEETDLFMAWEHRILHAPRDADATDQMNAMFEVMEYFNALLQARRSDPRNDLVSAAARWEIGGEPIKQDDLLAFCLLMFMAGLDTVTATLSYAFFHFATHDDDRRRLVTDPAVIPSAIEEVLRYYAIISTARKVKHDEEFHGCPLKAGDMVMMPFYSATRDPDAFVDADRFIIDRPNNNHIAFGAGPHRCLGAHLARRELKVAFEEWHARIPDYRIPAGVEVLEHGGQLGLELLPLEWNA